MVKKTLLILLVGMAFSGIAENILTNSDFSKLTPVGLPQGWHFTHLLPRQIAFQDGAVILTAQEKNAVIVQSALPLAVGKKYRLHGEFRAPEGVRYRAYVEWVGEKEGKEVWYNSGESWQNGSGKWQEFDASFSPTQYKSAILALQIGSNSKVEVRNLSLETWIPPVMPNSDFKKRSGNMPECWTVHRKKEDVVFGDDCVTLKGRGMLVHTKLNLKPGTNYRITYEVRGSGSFRAYYEQVIKKDEREIWLDSGTGYFTPGDAWVKKTVNFSYHPAQTVASHFAMDIKSGTAEVRHITAEIVPDAKFAGFTAKGSCKVVQADGIDTLEVTQSKEPATLYGIKLQTGKSYKVAFRCIGRGSAGNATNMHPFALAMQLGGTSIESEWDDVWNSKFQDKEFVFTVPENCPENAELMFRVRTKGAVVFKDLRIEECALQAENEPEIALDAPVYRNGIFASMPCKKITGKVNGSFSRGRIALLANDKVLQEVNMTAKSKSMEFELSAAELEVGAYTLRTILQGTDGEVTLSAPLNKYAPHLNEVVIDSNGNFRIGGKPFMAVILWEPCPSECIPFMVAHGFNTFRLPMAGSENAVLKTLNRLEAQGLKAMLAVPMPKGIDEETLLNYAQTLYNSLTEKVTAHPALLGYFLVDEPAWVGIPLKNIQAAYDVLRKVDPFHPAWLNEAPRGGLKLHRRYSRPCDVYGIDIYPVPYPNEHSALADKMMTAVGKYAALCREAGGAGKCVLMVLQGFSWSAYSGQDKLSGFPTLAESRFMIFDALTGGANSIAYWGTHSNGTPEFFADLAHAVKEAHELSPLFLNARRSVIPMNDSALRAVKFELDGKTYLTVLNTGAKTADVKINGVFQENTVKEYFTRSSVKLTSGTLEDKVEAWGVRLYRASELPASAALPDFHGENPYIAYLKKLNNRKFYNGNASWIWDAAHEEAGAECSLGYRLKIEGELAACTMLLSADDSVELLVNGQKAGEVSSWNKMQRFDLVPYLKTGENEIRLNAADAGQIPCGILGEISIRYTHGKTETVLTDAKWKTVGGTPAKVIAPYGGGAWGRKVTLPVE